MFAEVHQTLPIGWRSLLYAIKLNGRKALTEYGTYAQYLNGCMLEITDYDGTWHPLDPFCAIAGKPTQPSQKLKGYMREFTYEFVEEQRQKKEDIEKFVYLYMTRIIEPVDQIKFIREKFENGTAIDSRRLILSIYDPKFDSGNKSPPCLQRITLYAYSNKTCDVEINYRSWDLMAVEANIIAEVEMVKNYILNPVGFKVNRVRAFGSNCHYYLNDSPIVDAVLQRR